jgi:deoxyribonuclease (pyrimidine dimer)
MVRVNLINQKFLADQHLIAEYNEILMLLGYVRKNPNALNIPKKYCLGKGHILFFKNKLKYLKKRHELIKKEMIKRGFNPTKTVNLSEFSKKLANDWNPKKKDKDLIKKRLIEKIRTKPTFYRYYGEKRSVAFFVRLINNG